MTDRKDQGAGGKDDQPETAFDQWLNRGLHQMFDDVMNEPVPNELLKLLRDNSGEDGQGK